MSTPDRVVCYHKPFPCGNGSVTIVQCSPDHEHVRDSQTWYEKSIDCKVCNSKYNIAQIDEGMERFVILKPENSNQGVVRLLKID